MRVADTTLAGLADATGLTGHVLWDTERPASEGFNRRSVPCPHHCAT